MPDPDPHDHGTAAAFEQQELTHNFSDGAESITKRFKGGFSTITTLAGTYTIGSSTESGLPLRTKRLERAPGNLAVLVLDFAVENQDGGGGNATVLGTKWQIKHTQQAITLYRYCGQSAGASANRGRIEQWRRGNDAYLWTNYQWRDKNGAVNTLTSADQKLARKFMAGIETVMRFYPTIQKVTTFTKGKVADIGKKLSYIDTPSDAPTGWTSAADAWMKIGDDLTFDSATGVQVRTESWLGSEGFDANLYGDVDRWAWGSV